MPSSESSTGRKRGGAVLLALLIGLIAHTSLQTLPGSDGMDKKASNAPIDRLNERMQRSNHKPVSFRMLGSFACPSDEQSASTRREKLVIPRDILALDGTRVSLAGYVIPLDYNQKGIRLLALVKEQASCCFGTAPQLNHWVLVRFGRYEPLWDRVNDLVIVFGKLEVSPKRLGRGTGALTLYRMQAEDLIGAY